MVAQSQMRYPAYFLFPGKFAQPVAHGTELRDATAFPAVVLLWTVNTAEISLLVVQLFLINLNTCTKSRLWSKAEFVARAHSSVVPGWWQPNPCAACPRSLSAPHPCLPGIPACPKSLLSWDPCLPCILALVGSLPSLHPCPPGIGSCPASLPSQDPCPPGIPACPGSVWCPSCPASMGDGSGQRFLSGHPQLGTLVCVPGFQHSLSPCAVLSRGRVHFFFFSFSKILFSHANPSAVLGNAAASAAAEGARDERCHRATPIVKVT